MATTKKKSTTKTPVTKKVVKTPAVRKSTAKRTVAKKHTAVELRSFRPAVEKTPFMTFTFTRQSLYWLILSGLVLALGSWVMYLNVKIQSMYDQVELNTYLHETYTIPQNVNRTLPTER